MGKCARAGISARHARRVASPWDATLFRRRLHLVVEVNVILLVERLVTVEASAEIGAGVHGLVGLEGLVLPLAVAHVVGVLGAPARALFHHRVADEVAFDEAAVGVLFRVALGVELGDVLQHGDHGAARQRLALLGGVERRRAGVELAELLVVGAIDRGEEHARGVVLRKGDLVAAGARGTDGGERRDRAGDGRNGDGGADCHGVSPLALAAPAPYRSGAPRAARGATARAAAYSKPGTAVVTCR